ncbi:methyltransferase, TIGR04325 family [Oxalobacteraceae bacterium OM1]|nr:methyltransferase, TIGR04325 family [Oxalobacteraceae bacterium OM1]
MLTSRLPDPITPIPSSLFHGREVKPLYRVHRLLEELPVKAPLRGILERRYEREFRSSTRANRFRGVYASYEEAAASIPAQRPTGYDNEYATGFYADKMRRALPADYPVMFWLNKLFDQGERRLLDLGGHVGVSYYAYQSHMVYPPDMRWTVHDMPLIMARGRELARERDALGQLRFCGAFDDARGSDIMMALGAAQYLPDELPERFARWPAPPRHVLLNLLPVHMHETYWTLQSIGSAFCPYRIFGRDELIASYEALGYRLVDWWENAEKNCIIPFHPEHSLDRYFGFLFSLEE